MRISHKYKFVFISKPRCASTSIRNMLDPYSDIFSTSEAPYHHHSTALALKLHFDRMGWRWQDYFIFTTVRNPWDMIVSYYTRFQPDVNGIYNFEKERDGIAYQTKQIMPFKKWITRAKTHHRLIYLNGEFKKNIWVNGFSKITLANTINDIDGKSLVDEVLKVEDLDSTLPDTLKRLGFEPPPVNIHVNSSERTGYREYFDEVTRAIIEKEFASDIEFGKYNF